MKPLKIIKNRSDIGAGTRGSDLGIDALEIAAINKEDDFFNKHPFYDVDTHNESIYNKVNNPFAKRIHFVEEQCKRVRECTRKTLGENFFPLLLSGDHSSALGTLAGIRMTYPEKKLGVIWIDAHADLHTPLSSPSGNVHGMPLAAALGNDNKDFEINKTAPETLQVWEKMKRIAGTQPVMTSDSLVYFGLRDTEEAEDHVLSNLQITHYPVHEVRHRGIGVCVEETLKKLAHTDIIYISFDVDSMDCDSVSYGTGTPVSKGFDPDEVVSIIKGIMESEKVVCVEVAEINPLLDTKGNKMAETAFDVIRAIF